jgi:hypothetical protein
MRFMLPLLLLLVASANAIAPYQYKLLLLEKSMKKSLAKNPIYLKERQELKDVSYDRKHTFSLIYTLDIDVDEINVESFKDLWSKEFGNKFCLRPAIKKIMAENVDFSERYYDMNNRLISTLTFGKEQCKLFIESHRRIAQNMYYETLFQKNH